MERHFSQWMQTILLGLVLGLGVSGLQAAPTSPSDLTASPEETPQVSEDVKAALDDFRNLKFDDAIAKLEAARANNSDMAPPQLILAQWFGLANQGQAVRQAIEQTITKHPNDPEAYVVLAELNLQNGGITEAQLLYTQANSLNSKFAESAVRKTNIQKRILLGLAQVFVARGNFSDAEKYLQTVLASDANNVAALNLLGLIQFRNDQPAEVLRTYEKVKAAQPNTLLPEARLAMMYQQKGDEESKKEAAKYMVEAIKKAPRDVDVRLVATQWSLQIGNVKQAASQANAALQLKADSQEAQLLRGVVALFEKNFVVAEENFQKVLSASPSNFAASNNLALALCEQGDETKLKKAEEYALVNIRQFQNQPEAFSTAAWISYKKGAYSDAMQLLQKAAQLSGGQMNPDTAYYLAATLAKLGSDEQKNQAKELVNKILQSTVPFSMRPEAEALSKEL
ncbi:MAG: tetratricopeptide repeat protein [Planctomycetia bacterium]|nr:tetratricopeptide repeat protein [Planctomycetia bacterium]